MSLTKMTLQKIDNDSEKMLNQIMIYEKFNKAELEIIKLFDGKKLRDFSAKEKKDIVLTKILEIQGFLNIKDKYDKQYYIDLVSFLCDKHGSITINELELAVQLAVAQKSGDFEIINQISAIQFSKILNAYQRYISPIKVKINRAIEKKALDEKSQLTDMEKDAMAKQYIMVLFSTIDTVTDIEMFDIGNVAYDYLTERKIVSFNNDEKNEACMAAKKIIHSQLAKKLMDGGFRNKENLIAEIKKLGAEIAANQVVIPESKDVKNLAKKILLKDYLQSLKTKNLNIVKLID